MVGAFTVLDTVGVVGAFKGLERDMTERAYEPERSAWQTRHDEASGRLDDVRTKLRTLPTPSAEGEIRNRETYDLTVRSLERQIATAEADMATVGPPPVRATRFDDRLLIGLSLAIQVALVIGFLSIEAGRTHAHRRALWERDVVYQRELEAYQSGRTSASKKRTQTQKRRSRKKKTPPPEPLRLVASNDQ